MDMSTDSWADARKHAYTQTHTESDANTRRQTLIDRHTHRQTTHAADLSLAIKLSCPVSASTHFFMFLLLWHLSTSTRHSTAPRYTTLLCTTLQYAVLHYTALLCSAPCYTTLHYTTLLCTTLYYTTLYWAALHRATLHYTALFYTTLCCTDFCHNWPLLSIATGVGREHERSVGRQSHSRHLQVNTPSALCCDSILPTFILSLSYLCLFCLVVSSLILFYLISPPFILSYFFFISLLFSHFNTFHLLWNLFILHFSESLLCPLCEWCVSFFFSFSSKLFRIDWLTLLS